MQTDLLELQVAARTIEAEDIVSYDLIDPNGKPLPQFTAGAHIDVHGPTGVIRQYSLCNDPAERQRYQIGVLRAPDSRGGSLAMHDSVAVGDLIKVSPPRNHFELLAGGHRSLLIAGGIGITPILCMAERLNQAHSDFELHYCSRSLLRTAFRARIKAASYADNVFHHFDDGPKDQKFDLEGVLANQDAETHLYICGPTGFLEFVLDTAKAKGWEDDRLHYEYFGSRTISNEGDQPFQIKIASTGKLITVAADETAAQALGAAGIDIPLSCEQGVCGTCITRIIEGQPDHRDQYLTDSERASNNQFTPCCSRAKTAMLVLDL